MGIALKEKGLFAALQDCHTDRHAQKLVRQQVSALMVDDGSLMEDMAKRLVLRQIGYVSAYFDRERAAEILHLFQTVHPVYGAIEQWPVEVDELWREAKAAAIQYAAARLAREPVPFG